MREAKSREQELPRSRGVRTAEIVSPEDPFDLEPFFQEQLLAKEIRRLLSKAERQSWPIHYERFGCLYCHKSERPHAAVGFCQPCYHLVLMRRKAILRELKTGAGMPPLLEAGRPTSIAPGKKNRRPR
jgi:hypothetical protein